MLSRDDILKSLIDGELEIYPFEKKNLTGIGYNLSVTDFAFSIKMGILLTIYSKVTPSGIRHYVIIPANDTVLFFSKEYIRVSNKIAGTFHSKVARVCQGLGHISTTLDPTWKGQLIISVNNPTSKEIKFELDENSGNIFTLLLYKFHTPVKGANIHDNNSGRCDLLLEHFTDLCGSRYREKHLELKEYITNDFSRSLNGDDDFLNQEIKDEYSNKVIQLSDIKVRLKKDHIIIHENRYELGPEGEYHPLKNKKERELLQTCILFNIRNSIPDNNIGNNNMSTDLLKQEKFLSGELSKSKRVLEEWIRIIDYELEMINHIRRVRWQNLKALKFAAAESELVILRNRTEAKKIYTTISILILATLLLVSVFIIAVRQFNLSAKYVTILSPCLATIVTILIQNIVKLTQKRPLKQSQKY